MLVAPMPNSVHAQERTITVTGTARLQVPPDHADLDIGVSSDGKTVADALGKNAPLVKAVVQAMELAGVAPKNIQTHSFQIAAISPRLPNGDIDTSRTIGYSVTSELSVSLTEMNRIGEIIDVAARAGATDTRSISYSLTNNDAILAQVRADAMRDARRRAEQLVAPEHKTVGELLSVGRGISGSDDNLPTAFADFGGSLPSLMPLREMPYIAPEEIRVSESVIATFALQ